MFGFGKKVVSLVILCALLSALSAYAAPLLSVPTPSAAPELTPSPSPTAVPTPEPTAEPTPWPVTAAEVVPSAMEDDGVLRVRLSSLGAPEALNLILAGSYAVEGDAGFRFDRDAAVTLFEHNGSVWLHAGGLSIDMGTSVTLTRHGTDGDENGFYLAESEKPNIYNGSLTVSADGGALRAVLSIDVEEYLFGVVAYEMSDSFPIEALKAQAVAARTYAMQRKYAAGGRDYDLVDTTADQVFKGFDPQYKNVIAAVNATRGVVGTYNGGFAACYYTASNGGEIATPNDVWGGDGDYAYILRHDDPFDLENPRSLVNSLSFSKDLTDSAALRKMVLAALNESVTEVHEFIEITDVRLTDPEPELSRMYRTLEMDARIRVQLPEPTPEPGATEAPAFLPGMSFLDFFTGTSVPEPRWEERTVTIGLDVYGQIKDGLSLGLNSRDYELLTVVPAEAGYTLEMRRFGHGTGMSQRGAQQMAGAHGHSWQEILNFYYPGMALEQISWTTPALTSLENMPTAAGYARPVPTPTPTPAPLPALLPGEHYASVTATTLNVREQPTTEARILDRFSYGRELIVCSAPDADGWVKIKTAELQGYVKSDYLEN